MDSHKITSIPILSGEAFDALPESIRSYIRYLESAVQQLQNTVQQLQTRVHELEAQRLAQVNNPDV